MGELRAVVYSDIHHSAERIDDTLKVENQITDYCIKNGIKLVLFLGDRFKFRNPKGWIRDAVDRAWVQRMSQGISMITLVGQHDQYEKSRRLNSYNSFDVFKQNGIRAVDEDAVVDLMDGKKLFGQIHAVSYGSLGKYLAAVNDGKIIVDKKLLNIFVMHDMIKGARVSGESDYTTSGLDKEFLEKFDLVLCGDIHLPQQLEFEHAKGGYVGSALQLTKADIGSDRGFLDVTCSVLAKGEKAVKWMFVKSNAPDFIEVNVDDIQDIQKYKNCFVYLRVGKINQKQQQTIDTVKKVARHVFLIQEKEAKTNIKPIVGRDIYEELDLYLDTISTDLSKKELREYIVEKVQQI